MSQFRSQLALALFAAASVYPVPARMGRPLGSQLRGDGNVVLSSLYAARSNMQQRAASVGLPEMLTRQNKAGDLLSLEITALEQQQKAIVAAASYQHVLSNRQALLAKQGAALQIAVNMRSASHLGPDDGPMVALSLCLAVAVCAAIGGFLWYTMIASRRTQDQQAAKKTTAGNDALVAPPAELPTAVMPAKEDRAAAPTSNGPAGFEDDAKRFASPAPSPRFVPPKKPFLACC